MIFEAYDKNDQQTVDKSKAVTVQIVAMDDCHGKWKKKVKDHATSWKQDQNISHDFGGRSVERYGITQADLASRIDVSQKNVSDILNRKRYLTSTLAMRIEIVTGISGQLLLTLDDNYNLNLVEHEKDVSEHHSPLYLKRYDWVTS